MAQKPNKKPQRGQNKRVMDTAMNFFIAGCAAEIWLLMVRRFYVRGTLDQLMSWHNTYLPAAMWVGIAALIAGIVLAVMNRAASGKKRTAGLVIAGAGAFLAVTSPAIRVMGSTALTPLSVLVPVVMVLGILWHLYDRECVCALAVLCGTAMVLWVSRKGGGVWNAKVLAVAVIWLAVCAVLVVLLRKAQKAGGTVKNVRILPENADYLPIWLAAGVSAALLVVGLASATLAYYAMWAAALLIFAMAVYYTVQQL